MIHQLMEPDFQGSSGFNVFRKLRSLAWKLGSIVHLIQIYTRFQIFIAICICAKMGLMMYYDRIDKCLHSRSSMVVHDLQNASNRIPLFGIRMVSELELSKFKPESFTCAGMMYTRHPKRRPKYNQSAHPSQTQRPTQ